MAVDTRLITAEELAEMEPGEGLTELIRGELVRMPPPGFDHAIIVSTMIEHLSSYVRKNKLGVVAGNGGFMIEHDPDTVLAPDIAFVEKSRLPGKRSGYPDLAPSLVIEVVSPSDLARNVNRKVQYYLGAGVPLVVVVWPETRLVTLSTPDGNTKTLQEHDQLDLGSVIPGFTLPIKAIFE